MFKRKPRLTREQSLSARPVRLVSATIKPAGAGGGTLTVRMTAPRWAGWLLRYPDGATRTFELDSVGVFFWECCDGNNSVQQIIHLLAAKYKLNLREAEVSSLQFIQMLARKGLIGLEVEKKK